jgi:hypothetical protein
LLETSVRFFGSENKSEAPFDQPEQSAVLKKKTQRERADALENERKKQE